MQALNRNQLHALLLSACSALLVVLFLPGLEGPLVLDSVKLHRLEGLVEEHGNLAVLHTPAFSGDFLRIVSMASFVLDIQVAGEISPEQFKSTNVGIHIVTAMLIYFLTRLLMRTTSFREAAPAMALATSLIWLFSPLNFNVVLYAVQRMAMLSTLFVVLGLLLYAAGRLQDDRRLRRLGIGSSVLVCLPLAFFSKENGILLVPLAFLVELFFLHPARPWFTARQLGIAAVAGVIAAAVLAALFVPNIVDYGSRPFTLTERLFSQPRALVSYVSHLLVPLGADAGIYTDGFAVSHGLLSPVSTLFAIAACLAGIAFCVLFRHDRLRFVAFGLAFFFVGHSIESTIVPLEMYFEHRNYLPSYGLYFSLAALLVLYMPRRSWAVGATLVYCAYFAVIDHARANTWSNRANVAMAAVQHNPRSARAWSNLAQLATESGQFDLAERSVNRTIELAGTPNSRVQRLYILCQAGRDIEAPEYEALPESRNLGLSNEVSQALSNLLALYEQGQCPELRIPALVTGLDDLAARYMAAGLDPWTVQYHADAFLYAAGQRERAHSRLDARFGEGHLESGLYRLELLIGERSTERAEALLRRIKRRMNTTGQHELEAVVRDLERRLDERR